MPLTEEQEVTILKWAGYYINQFKHWEHQNESHIIDYLRDYPPDLNDLKLLTEILERKLRQENTRHLEIHLSPDFPTTWFILIEDYLNPNLGGTIRITETTLVEALQQALLKLAEETK